MCCDFDDLLCSSPRLISQSADNRAEIHARRCHLARAVFAFRTHARQRSLARAQWALAANHHQHRVLVRWPVYVFSPRCITDCYRAFGTVCVNQVSMHSRWRAGVRSEQRERQNEEQVPRLCFFFCIGVLFMHRFIVFG
jgi:hypothetical protein